VDNVLLIGADGGATEVKAHAVACDDLEAPRSFELRPESASRVYGRVAGFTPLPVSEQLAQRDAGRARLTATETKQGDGWVTAAAEAIGDVARQCGARRVLVGIGMPGLKTPDGRGINVINNGPRMPHYLDALETKLAAAGMELVAPIAALGSDADYCGLGEEYAADGLFRNVQNAYYVGCGTGIADALKLRGRLVPFDQAKSWIQKSWQMPSALGPTFEKLVSAASLNRVYANLVKETERRSDEVTGGSESAGRRRVGGKAASAVETDEDTARGAVAQGQDNRTARRAVAHGRSEPRSVSERNAVTSHYPEVAAIAGDPIAIAWLTTAALVLAELIFERLCTIRNGRAHAAHRGEAYAKLEPDHEYRGTLLDRVIIGQRVGQIYGEPTCRAVFGDRLDTYLAAMIAASSDERLAAATVVGGVQPTPPGKRGLKPSFVTASRLRAAPALGAAVAAVQALRREDS
jgi:hypothetical protein